MTPGLTPQVTVTNSEDSGVGDPVSNPVYGGGRWETQREWWTKSPGSERVSYGVSTSRGESGCPDVWSRTTVPCNSFPQSLFHQRDLCNTGEEVK